jgi:MFS family permease
MPSETDLKQTLGTALVFATAIAVVNGFGRFAYALLLPVMRQDLNWDYSLSGWLNTANSLGYGIGALAGLWLLGRYKPANLFVSGLVVTVSTLLLCGFTRDLNWMLFLRFLSGIGSAWVFACGGAIVANYYSNDPARSAGAIAIYYAGGGLGIVLSGLLLMPVLGAKEDWFASLHWTWATGWFILGICGFIFSLWPSQLALKLEAWSARTINEKLPNTASSPKPSAENVAPLPWRFFSQMLMAYFLFGIGYIVYLTFVVAWLKEMQMTVIPSIGVWVVLGLAVMASGYVWRKAMAHWKPPTTFAAACICTGIGTALPLLSNQYAMVLVSATFVGGSFFMAPSAMMALAKKHLPNVQLALAMNLFTFVFAIGQGIGPVAAGWIADASSLSWAMGAGAFTLLIAAILAFTQRDKQLTTNSRIDH